MGLPIVAEVDTGGHKPSAAAEDNITADLAQGKGPDSPSMTNTEEVAVSRASAAQEYQWSDDIMKLEKLTCLLFHMNNQSSIERVTKEQIYHCIPSHYYHVLKMHCPIPLNQCKFVLKKHMKKRQHVKLQHHHIP